MIQRHAWSLHVDDGAVFIQCMCLYERDNEDRPCWPRDENGDPEPAPQGMCNYIEWVENTSFDELVHGEARLALPDARVVWANDAMEVHLS